MQAPPKRSASRPRTQAERADRHRLYERAVQCPEAEIEFLERVYRERRGRKPTRLREDFCGTALVCAEWARRRRANTAIGVDLDPAVLDYGRAHHLALLDRGARSRVTLINADVLRVATEPVDVLLATNFSYWIFAERARLRAYFRRARAALAPGGLMLLDAFGGYDAFRVLRERRVLRGFTYVWDQADYDPVTGRYVCHIHFHFPDGSKLERAFSYHWRLWTLPEIRDLLAAAGFARVTVYWEGTDPATGQGNGEFQPAERGDPDAGWIAYLVAEP